MTNAIDRWEDIDHAKAEAEVFSVQRRIFNASRGGNHAKVLRLQRLLLSSLNARYLAVRRVALKNSGRKTPGVDGIHSLTKPQMLNLVQNLDITGRQSPLRRVNLAKSNGKTRPLSIPTIKDRAVQTMIAMALWPQWEARLPPHMYGFRSGRSVHDAAASIREHIQRSPKWLLDADIAAYFDNISRTALMKKLDTLPAIRRATRNMLQSGIIENFKWERCDKGVPQGSSLSVLCGCIMLSGLEADLAEAFPPKRKINNQPVGKPPRVVIYADDLVIFADRRDVIVEIKTWLTQWLAQYGLALSEEKTHIAHSLDGGSDQTGFNFLGFTFTQHRVGRHQIKQWYGGVFTRITPSQKAVTALKEKLSEIIMDTRPNPKRNAEYAHRRATGKPGHQQVLIERLNPILKGWAYHYRAQNSKETFSDLKQWLWGKLWKWTKRHYGKMMSRRELVSQFFNDGNPWVFKVKSPTGGEPVELFDIAGVEVDRKWHKLVRANESYYSGNWIYWSKTRGRYPGIAAAATKAMRNQHGKCPRCKRMIEVGQRLAMIVDNLAATNWERKLIVHHDCMRSTDKEGGAGPIGTVRHDRR